jgi:hypothetical protein
MKIKSAYSYKFIWMIMKRISTLIAIYFVSVFCYADIGGKISYHCPPANHVDTHRHEYASYTEYNGLVIDWFSIKSAPDHVQVVKFDFARIYSEHDVGCVYDVSNGDIVTLQPSGSSTNYKFKYYSANNKWDHGLCESNNPEECVFYIQTE